MEERLIKLEILYSDQSRMLEDLSGELYQQQQEILRLKTRIKVLEDDKNRGTEEFVCAGV